MGVRLRTRVGCVGFLATLLVVGTGSAALAHFIYDTGYVWESGSGKCVDARAEISHGTDMGGYTQAWTHTVKEITWPYTIHCFTDWSRPAGYLKVKNVLQKCAVVCNGMEDYYWCANTSWEYNDVTASELEQEKYWNRPCGNGIYSAWAGAFTYFNNQWVGGQLWAGGGHSLP